MEDIQEAAASVGIDLSASLKKSESKQAGLETTNNNLSTHLVSTADLFYKLLEKYKLHDAIANYKKYFSEKATQNDSAKKETKPVNLSPKEFHEQVASAKIVRSALIAKQGKKFSPERLKQKFPFIETLYETEIFAHQVILFQDGSKFTSLFNETNQPHSQDEAAVIFNSWLSPVADQSIAIGELYNLSSPKMLQILFDELEKLIIQEISDHQKMQDENEEKLDELPLGIIINHFDHHSFTLGYSQQQKKWILFDIRQRPLKLISGSDLGYELFYAASCVQSFSIITEHAEAKFGYLEKTQEWIILTLKEKPSSKPEFDSISYHVIQTLKNNLRTIHELRFIMYANIFVGSKIDPKILNKIKQWMNSATFKKFSKITYASTSLDDLTQQSLLNYAAYTGKLSLAQMILSLNKNLLENDSPLMNAVESRQIEMVALLLSEGANPNTPLNSGTLPSTYAAEYGFLDIVKLLHAAKANFELTNQGSPPLRFAAEHNQPHIVEYLLNEAKVDPNAGIDYDSLNIAAERGHIEIVKLLLASGKVDINRISSQTTFTPLATAVYHGHCEVVKLLLAADPKPFEREFCQSTYDVYLRQYNRPEMQRVFSENEERKKMKLEEESAPKNIFSLFCCRKRKKGPKDEKPIIRAINHART